MTKAAFDFDQIIAPLGPVAFFRDHYEKRHLVLHRNDPDYYRPVLDLDAVWHHIETCPLAASRISMVRFGSDQVAADYLGNEQHADPRRVVQMYDEGWTIALNRMHEQMPSLAAMCQAVEARFSARFQTNLYLTPPNAQGFKPHWDTHDVFVMQIHGAKAWSIYDTKIELPLVGQSFNTDPVEPGPVSDEFVLRAGDLLYCPRGLMHAAHAGAESSLHITFGLMAKTWSEVLLEAVATASLADPRLRQNLPIGFARDDSDRASLHAAFGQMLAALPGAIDVDAVIDHFRDSFVAANRPALPGQARQVAGLDALTASSRCCSRPDLIFRTTVDDTHVTLAFGATSLALPRFVEAAIGRALGGAAFIVSDLPGPLDSDGKLTLVRRLIREGLVVALPTK